MGDVGQNCSLYMKTCTVTGIQIVTGDCDGQKQEAQAGTAPEWGFLIPVKLNKFTHDFANVSPKADKLL